MTKEQATQIVSQYETLVVLATYNILFTNDIVCGKVIEALSMLENHPLYRHRTKQIARRVDYERKAYEKLVNEIIADRSQFFADANEVFGEEVNKHVEILYYCIKREFDRHNIKYSGVISRLETARTLCEFACKQFDKRLEELREQDRRFSGFNLEYIRMTRLMAVMNELMRTLHIPCVVDLNTPECLSAIDVLAKKLVDGENIARAISA